MPCHARTSSAKLNLAGLSLLSCAVLRFAVPCCAQPATLCLDTLRLATLVLAKPARLGQAARLAQGRATDRIACFAVPGFSPTRIALPALPSSASLCVRCRAVPCLHCSAMHRLALPRDAGPCSRCTATPASSAELSLAPIGAAVLCCDLPSPAAHSCAC
jgi:hypothetical protein